MSAEDLYEYKRVDCEWNLSEYELKQILADGWEYFARYRILADDGRKLDRHVFRRQRHEQDTGSLAPVVPMTPGKAREYGETLACQGAHLEEAVMQAISRSHDEWFNCPERHKLFYEMISGFCGIRLAITKPGMF